MIIDEIELSPAHNILSMTKLKINATKTTAHNDRLKWHLFKASSYLSIGHIHQWQRIHSSDHAVHKCSKCLQQI